MTERGGGTAEASGITRATLETTAKEFPPGMYKAELIGTRGGKVREGSFSLIAPPKDGLIVQVVPSSGDALTLFTFYTSGLTPGSNVNITVSGPMGGVFPVNGMGRTQLVGERGTFTATLVPKSLNTEVLVGPWAFIVQETGSGGQNGFRPVSRERTAQSRGVKRNRKPELNHEGTKTQGITEFLCVFVPLWSIPLRSHGFERGRGGRGVRGSGEGEGGAAGSGAAARADDKEQETARRRSACGPRVLSTPDRGG